ncbi:MAG: ABC transporter permease [Candidatus Thiodiazotropha sp. (ex Ctena orbiculata)]|nr:ABC transporter permease [Candidatus Thiodiazotropha taylori]PUB89499.1 MAG: ABC transporter permease [gamma proteobacterium symbiont of Ctena orbiculata]MBT2997801.1 ABC transporter permease [Candidatus Thiodiazotropha taylori]MBT3000430.1 ABC transporter permease [Candidatus Thiodiazotropha taylori]MBT3027434.1 ABC transporter permease [Candidatus Thiodiazotropha taylori]
MAIDRQEAQVISLHHDDETPLAGAEYELFAAGADLPYQSGRTDARGRVVFIPGDLRQWRLRVFGEDGHGLDTHFESTADPRHQGHVDHEVSKTSLLVLGLGILLSGFGAALLFAKRNRH